MLHHVCECPTCRFKEFNYERLKEQNEAKNALLLEAAQYLENQCEVGPAFVVLASRLRAAARSL